MHVIMYLEERSDRYHVWLKECMYSVFSFELQLASEQVKKKARPVLIKKMYVLGGLLIEQYHEQMKMTSRSKVKDKRMVIISILFLWNGLI